MRVRPLDTANDEELNTVVAFSLMGVWEDAPEARRQPDEVPAMTFSARRELYDSTLGDIDFRIYVCVDDEGFIRGAAVCRMAKDSRNTPYGHTVSLYVEPAFRKQKVATALCQAAHQFYSERGADYVWAEAHHANTAGLSLFRALGYSFSEPRWGRWWFYVCMKRLEGTLPPPTNPGGR